MNFNKLRFYSQKINDVMNSQKNQGDHYVVDGAVINHLVTTNKKVWDHCIQCIYMSSFQLKTELKS